jgi:exonuclease III
MKLIAWNYRGLGNSPAVCGLLKCQKSEEADILFLSETELDEKRLVTTHVQLGWQTWRLWIVKEKGGSYGVMAERS